MSSEQEPKDELEKLAGDVRDKGKEIANMGRGIVLYGQLMADMGELTERRLKYPTPTNIDWPHTIGAWKYALQQEDNIIANLGEIAVTTASGNAVAYTMTSFSEGSYIDEYVPEAQRPEAHHITKILRDTIYRQADKTRVLALFREYGLCTKGEKSPAELFETAYAAYEAPVMSTVPVSTSLIPMRECIRGTIQTLIRRRPIQEEAKRERDKIVSIGKQLRADGIPEEAFLSLADRWRDLNDELSGYKRRITSRDEWILSLTRATLFLKELLESLDPSKMK